MARELKKPSVIMEKDLKEYAGPIEIDVSPKQAQEKPIQEEVEENAEVIIPAGAAIPQQSVPVVKLMTFGAWFQKRGTNNPKMKLSYKEAIEAHCKSIGIGPQATEEEYDAALSHFGL
jgi:hypothetical protein